ncbi:polysaccharide deacetylase family protein [Paenibacillus sp. OAS669]|uniref:polysaccharide deacetylase family protein n=1 Tax=Paenibacillus sp. OAS669 TaxID=2663821 RepID=UPI00178B9E47|nr:polysaccharide deacetylase family protein [Paenibacillus sp. OAS669]MBE1446453.1 putative sporulation protein (polysaccharide deacetylase family) [Paenibacillus sp. OAS669]
MKRVQVLVLSGIFAAAFFGIQQSKSLQAFVQDAKLRQSSSAASSPGQWTISSAAASVWGGMNRLEQDRREALKQRIQQEAQRRYIAPINAKVDRVWKAIPGYNGLEVDIEQSLALTEQQPNTDNLKIVTKEIKPAIGLEQLGPQPIYKGNPNKPMVSLMINVAWGNEYLDKMLDVLEKEQVHATFFFDGSWLKNNIPTALKIKEKGHELSNHAYSHKNMSELSSAKATEEITKTQLLLEKELGVQNRLFAPPSGDFDQETVNIAHSLKLQTILWTLDTVDWMKPEPATIIRKISTKVEPGSLILMHPTASSSSALQQMIKIIKSKGLVLGTVSELISSNRVPEVESAPH